MVHRVRGPVLVVLASQPDSCRQALAAVLLVLLVFWLLHLLSLADPLRLIN